VNYQELVQRISDRCGIELSIVDDIIRALLTLTTDELTDTRRPNAPKHNEDAHLQSGNDFRFADV
jgi:hypothetical protein